MMLHAKYQGSRICGFRQEHGFGYMTPYATFAQGA